MAKNSSKSTSTNKTTTTTTTTVGDIGITGANAVDALAIIGDVYKTGFGELTQQGSFAIDRSLQTVDNLAQIAAQNAMSTNSLIAGVAQRGISNPTQDVSEAQTTQSKYLLLAVVATAGIVFLSRGHK